MASTYSPTLRIELIGTGDQSGLWGDTTNTNLGSLIEQAITGVESIPMADANYTLTALNGSIDEARNAVLIFTSAVALTATRDVIIPNVEKLYLIKNSTTGSQSINITASGGAGYLVPNGKTAFIYCDGTNCIQAITYLNSPTLITPAISGNTTVSGDLTITGTLVSGSGGYTVLNSNNFNTYTPTLTGTGASGTWGINISGNAATATNSTNSTNLVTSNWTVNESGGKLLFKYGGVTKMSLDSSGNIITVGNVTAYGTP